MKPIEAYENVSARATKLLSLHNGMVNIRKRRIRSDWKSSFTKLMRWPSASSIERVDTRDAIVILRDGANLEPDDFSTEALDDLLRSALVIGVSALDRYIHERITKSIVEALKKPELNKTQRDFSIPAVLAIRITTAVARARRDGQTIRPANEVRKQIQELLHKRPFQSWREVEEGFALIGVTGLSGKIQAQRGVADINPMKRQLDKIVKRRNEIVHEGDLVKHSRGGQVRCHSVSPNFVQESLNFLDAFVASLDSVA